MLELKYSIEDEIVVMVEETKGVGINLAQENATLKILRLSEKNIELKIMDEEMVANVKKATTWMHEVLKERHACLCMSQKQRRRIQTYY